MRVLDLFSGIGGFSLGLERAGFRTVAFAEIDQWCQRILAKHWPSVPQLGDVTKLGITPMSCAGVSHAKTLATQAEAPALPPPAPVSGGGYAEPFAWYDRSTHLWRTWQRSLTEGWTPFLETWPRSGMTRSGIAYQLPTLAPLTYGTGFGSSPTHSVPTPTSSDHIERQNTTGALNPDTNKAVTLDRWVKFWPTPRAEHDSGRHRGKPDTLHSAVKMWPTPDASAANVGERPETWLARRERIKAKGINGNGMGTPLGIAVQMWPTPDANRRGQSKNPDATTRPSGSKQQRTLENALASSGNVGALNPTWVEWLMGFPHEWTVLKDWATRSSRKSRKSSGGQS